MGHVRILGQIKLPEIKHFIYLGPYACRPDSSTIRGYLLSGG